MTEDLNFLLVERGVSPLIAEGLVDQLKDTLDVVMEAVYLVTKVLGGEISYTYLTKAEHEVEMVLRAK